MGFPRRATTWRASTSGFTSPSGAAIPWIRMWIGRSMPMTPAPAMKSPHQKGSIVSILYRIRLPHQEDGADHDGRDRPPYEHHAVELTRRDDLLSHAQVYERSRGREGRPGMVEDKRERDDAEDQPSRRAEGGRPRGRVPAVPGELNEKSHDPQRGEYGGHLADHVPDIVAILEPPPRRHVPRIAGRAPNR